jgi:hypothetical protein
MGGESIEPCQVCGTRSIPNPVSQFRAGLATHDKHDDDGNNKETGHKRKELRACITLLRVQREEEIEGLSREHFHTRHPFNPERTG